MHTTGDGLPLYADADIFLKLPCWGEKLAFYLLLENRLSEHRCCLLPEAVSPSLLHRIGNTQTFAVIVGI